MIVGYLPLWLSKHSKIFLRCAFLFRFEITLLLVEYTFFKTIVVKIARKEMECMQYAPTFLESIAELVEIAREEIEALCA